MKNYLKRVPLLMLVVGEDAVAQGAGSSAHSGSLSVSTVLLSAALAALLIAFLWRHHLRTVKARYQALMDERTRHLTQTNASLQADICERERINAQLIDVEARSRQAYESAPIGMGAATTEGRPLRWNSAFSALLWESTRPTPKSLTELIAPHDRGRFDAFFTLAVIEAKKAASAEFCCLGRSGDLIHAVWVLSLVSAERESDSYVLIQVLDVTETRELTDQLRHQASFDELTGLRNRRAFAAALTDTVVNRDSHPEPGFLMFMDLDQFKVVNDTCGHGAGDALLKQVAYLIAGCVRSDDVIARLGGDEFAVMLPGCKRATAERVAESVRRAVEELAFPWGNNVFRIGVSVGAVSLATSKDTEELMQIADAACYAAKDAGRNHVHIVEGDKDITVDRRGEMRWVQRINDALENEQFVLFGQRIEALSDWPGGPEHVEVLVRMRDATKGTLIPPGAFLPAAERYGLSGKLDLWIVRRLLEHLTGLARHDVHSMRYWINLSGATLGDAKCCSTLIDMLETAELPAGLVNFEITETAVIRSKVEANRLLDALRDLGCGLALDDFGSGLSSFGYLKEFKVDRVKIDGMFVRDIAHDETDRVFVKSIVDIAHTLGIAAVAEFVEDAETLEVVRSLGADFAQGFGIHRPEMLEFELPNVELDRARRASQA